MPYNSIIDRTGAASLIPTEYSQELLTYVPESSVVMRLARPLAPMSSNTKTMPVLSALPTAYFVNGDTGMKQTTEVSWADKTLTAEELAVIVPIPENVLDDADYDIWAAVRPLLVEAFGIAFDKAVLYGTNAPASWPDDIVTAATAASMVVSLADHDDIYQAIMSEDTVNGEGVLMRLEAIGYMANGHVAHTSLRGKLRGLRDSNGNPIFKTTMQDGTRYELDGEPMYFPRNGTIDSASGLLYSGDWSQLVYALRQDVTWKVLTEAVIQDAAGTIVYNLAQQDMVALRAVMRLAWQLPNPINRLEEDEASRYPFAIMTA